MKAQELRIGNYITVDGNHAVVKRVEENGIVAYIPTSIGNIEPMYGVIEPIPLTEEWLVKFGFKMHEGNNYYRYWIIGDDIVKGLELTFRPALEGVLFCYTPRQTDNRNEIHIKHVHQLQNLYYALTGEEL